MTAFDEFAVLYSSLQVLHRWQGCHEFASARGRQLPRAIHAPPSSINMDDQISTIIGSVRQLSVVTSSPTVADSIDALQPYSSQLVLSALPPESPDSPPSVSSLPLLSSPSSRPDDQGSSPFLHAQSNAHGSGHSTPLSMSHSPASPARPVSANGSKPSDMARVL